MTKKRMIAILSAIGVLVVALVVVLIVSLTGNKTPSVPGESSTDPAPEQTEPVDVFDPRSLKKDGVVYVIPGNDGVYTVYTCEGDAVVSADLYIHCGTYENAEAMRKVNQQLIDTKKEEATYTRVTVRDCYFVGTMRPADLASTGLDKKALEMLVKAFEQVESQPAQ